MFMYQYYVILIRYKIGGRIRNSFKEGFRVVLSSIHVSCGVKHGLKTIGRAPLVGRDSSSLGFEVYWVKRNNKKKWLKTTWCSTVLVWYCCPRVVWELSTERWTFDKETLRFRLLCLYSLCRQRNIVFFRPLNVQSGSPNNIHGSLPHEIKHINVSY